MVVGHPFDLVKVRLQTAEKGVYTSAIDVVRKTVAREGLARVCIYRIIATLGRAIDEKRAVTDVSRGCMQAFQRH